VFGEIYRRNVKMRKKYKLKSKKSKYGDILLDLENYMTGEKKSCKNKCIFCFIDQMPGNCRESLYFKDDDERLSFIHGNYITLTNLEDSDIDRIIKMRISPVNISVHTTNPALRVKIMGNKRAGDVLKYIKILADGEININAQIVLCKNINDGVELERTLADLCAFYPAVQSTAVVPAGLTKYRDGNNLFRLEPFDKQDCEKIIETVNKFGRAYCADEFYLKAGQKVPGGEYYGDYPQYENGVGMIRSFYDDFYEAIKHPQAAGGTLFTKEGKGQAPRKISVVTGEAAYDLIKTLADDMAKKHGIVCGVYKIKNDFFGEEITVAGLITGRDIIGQLAPHKNNLGDELLIPAVMLRYERDLFLDNTSVGDIENALEIKVRIVENNAKDFIKKICECDYE
jgi:putative radical SAM enzyme (TIGR03279 family)